MWHFVDPAFHPLEYYVLFVWLFLQQLSSNWIFSLSCLTRNFLTLVSIFFKEVKDCSNLKCKRISMGCYIDKNNFGPGFRFSCYLLFPLCKVCISMLRFLSCVATRVFSVRLLHAVAFSKKLRWLAQTKVITLKTQPHAVNACWKRVSQRSFTLTLSSSQGMFNLFFSNKKTDFNLLMSD